MEELGVVVEVKEDGAVVRMMRAGSCEGCSAGGSCKAVSGDRLLIASNPVGAKPGQHVEIKIEGGAFLKASFLVYMVPIIFLFIGAALGGNFGPRIYGGMSVDYWQALAGAAFLALSIVAVRLYDKKVKNNSMLKPVITKILDQPGERIA